MIAFAGGCALASVGIWTLLCLGLATPWAVWLVTGAALTGSLRGFGLNWRRPHPLWLLTLPGLLLTLVNALAPEIQPDATTYHLGLVAEWARTGSFSPRIGFYEILPLGLEALFLPAYLAAGPVAAKLVHFTFFAASLPLVTRVGEQCGAERSRAVLAAVFYSATPVVMICASSAYTDAGLVFFVLAAFSALLAREDGAAGLSAGFCYAIKVTGGIVAAIAIGWLAARREWRRIFALAPAALLVSLPWMARALWLTGNPVAPLGNRIFPNDWFHIHTEKVLATFLANYGGVHGWAIWRSLLWGGESLQGLLGPMCAVLPLGLLALRRRETRPLAVAGLLLLLPWTMNLGARFLMPALPFAALAAASVVPRGVFACIVVVHAALAWPGVMDHYTDRNAWRLRGVPWQAAFGIESHDDYLTRRLWEYRFAKEVSAKVGPGEILLDLYGLPYAYMRTVPLGPLPSAEFDNIVYTLNSAMGGIPERVYRIDCRWPLEFLREVRVGTDSPWPIPFAITEARPLRFSRPVRILRNWFLDAHPNAGDSPLAMDNNAASRWTTIDAAVGGEWWAVRFDRPVPIDGMTFHVVNAVPPLRLKVTLTDMAGQSRQVCHPTESVPAPLDFRRRAAMGYAKSRGVRWIAGRTQGGGHSIILRRLESAPAAYGVTLASRVDDLVLFRVN